jgi:hypothetical protein
MMGMKVSYAHFAKHAQYDRRRGKGVVGKIGKGPYSKLHPHDYLATTVLSSIALYEVFRCQLPQC